MIVFSSLQIRRGVRVLLDNASATINPGQKVGLVGKNGCGKSTLLALLKNEISADAGSFTLPGTWQLAWVNQETPALPQPAIEYVIASLTISWNVRSATFPAAGGCALTWPRR